jgi:hypothetical protein
MTVVAVAALSMTAVVAATTVVVGITVMMAMAVVVTLSIAPPSQIVGSGGSFTPVYFS